jgi:L-iditol 2-dehydrogenase
VRLETRELACGPTDLMLKIAVCGRCGTDRRLFQRAHPRVKTPTVLGHELVGRVVETGARVRTLTRGIGYREGQTLSAAELDFAPGQRVTVQSRVARHRAGLMLMQDPIQNLTFQIPGAYSQYMLVPEEMIRAGAVLRVPDNVQDEEAALTEPAACALESIFSTPHAHGVDADGRHLMRGGVKPGGRILIIGSGTLAMIYARLAQMERAGEVWMMVRSAAKAAFLAAKLGPEIKLKVVADYASLAMADKHALETRLENEFAEATRGALFDDIVLACHAPDAQRLMFRLLNPDGYAVAACFAGLNEACEQANVDLLHYRIGKAVGTSGCSTRTMETILRLLATNALRLEGFCCPTHYNLRHDPADFFCTAADGRKPMLYPWE